MAQTRLEHQKAWESLGGAARSTAPRPASSYISHQNYAATQNIAGQDAYYQNQAQQANKPLQRRPVPYRQYPKAEVTSRPSRASPVHNAKNVPSVLAVGQARQQPQPQQYSMPQQQQLQQAHPSQYRHSLHPQTLMPYYQHQQARQQQQQPPPKQVQQIRQQPSPPPQQQQQNSRNGADSGYVDWAEAASRLSVASASTATSRLSAISTSTAASSAPSMSCSMASPLEHVPIPCATLEYEESPLARLQSHLPIPELASSSTPANRSSMVVTPTHDPSLCPEPLRVPRRPVSMGAAPKPHRPELRISTQVAEPTALKFSAASSHKAARIATPGTSVDPSSAYSYRSADYEDYMSPVLASEQQYSRGWGSASASSSNGSSEFDLDLNEMLRAELELKLGLMSLGPIRSHIETGGKLSAIDAAADPMLAAEWQRWREYLNEGADEE